MSGRRQRKLRIGRGNGDIRTRVIKALGLSLSADGWTVADALIDRYVEFPAVKEARFSGRKRKITPDVEEFANMCIAAAKAETPRRSVLSICKELVADPHPDNPLHGLDAEMLRKNYVNRHERRATQNRRDLAEANARAVAMAEHLRKSGIAVPTISDNLLSRILDAKTWSNRDKF